MRWILLLLAGLPLLASGQFHGPTDPLRSGYDPMLAPFYHGVASGDPEMDRVIIWTRVTTDSLFAGVQWRVALDTAMFQIVASGNSYTDATTDHTVKVDVTGLQPFTFYYYEFEYEGMRSIRGRTRTIPAGPDVDSLRFAVVSCSNYANGFFNAYDRIRARNDVFAVIHLGDYIYEYGDGELGNLRTLEPSTEILDLPDYRMRHSHYKLDPDLMRLHQQYPFIAVWDDHETANNAWMGGAANHDPGEGEWEARKNAGIQAYAEWMPIRLPDPEDPLRIYRRYDFGDLITLHMLDTRLIGREEQDGASEAPDRTLLGTEQYNWLAAGMSASNARWQILGQQVMMAPLRAFGIPVNPDQWDGYPAERQKIYDHVIGNNIRNMVVLTGDIHSSWANDLPDDGYVVSTGANSAGVEFVTTSITSASFDLPVSSTLIQLFNGHIKYVDLPHKGYLIIDVDRQRVQGDWFHVQGISQPDTVESHATSRRTLDQSRRITNVGGPSVAHPNIFGVQAPWDPRMDLGVQVSGHSAIALVGAYPNPFLDHIDLQFNINGRQAVTVDLLDASGNLLRRDDLGELSGGIRYHRMHVSQLAQGSYMIRIIAGGTQAASRMIKAGSMR